MREKKAAVFATSGLSHGLMMMVAAHRLYMQGYSVTTFHNTLTQLRHWFPGHHFARVPALSSTEWLNEEYDLVLCDGSDKARVKHLSDLYHNDTLKTLSIFYPRYNKEQDPPLSPWDRVFSDKKPMVDNIAKAIASLFHLNHVSKNNGLIPLSGLKHRAHPRRVILSPTSGTQDLRWTPSRFLKTARNLRLRGFTPVFAVAPAERTEWLSVLSKGYALPEFASLSDLAEMVYESGYLISNDAGAAHLASNLQIPCLIIAKERKKKTLWKPGWLNSHVISPSPLLPRFKKHPLLWRHLISVPNVMGHFKKLTAKDKIPF